MAALRLGRDRLGARGSGRWFARGVRSYRVEGMGSSALQAEIRWVLTAQPQRVFPGAIYGPPLVTWLPTRALAAPPARAAWPKS